MTKFETIIQVIKTIGIYSCLGIGAYGIYLAWQILAALKGVVFCVIK